MQLKPNSFLTSGVTTSATNLANGGSNSGILSYSPASILAPNSKQKSAFAPVRSVADMGFGASTGGFGMSGLQAGWTHTFYNVGFTYVVSDYIICLYLHCHFKLILYTTPFI